MAIFEGISELINIFCSALLVETAIWLLLQSFVHLASGRKLQNQVDPSLVVKVTKHPKYVGVAKMALDFNLTTKLMLHLCLLQLGLEEDLQSHNELGPLLTSQIDVAKFPLAKGSADLEVTQLPAIPGIAFRQIRMYCSRFLKWNKWKNCRPASKEFSLLKLTFASPGFEPDVPATTFGCWDITLAVFLSGSRPGT